MQSQAQGDKIKSFRPVEFETSGKGQARSISKLSTSLHIQTTEIYLKTMRSDG